MTRHARHHPHRSRIRGFGYFKRLGPGFVTGASDDDPSGIGTYSQVGAAFGYGLLWTALLSFPLAAAVQETAARLGLSSGKGLAALIKERFPRWVLMFAVGLVSVANIFNIGADLGSMGAAIRLLLPIPLVSLVIGLALLITALEVFLPYHRYARILRWTTGSLIAYVLVLASVKVDWGAVAHNTFIPHLESNKAYLAALIAVFGTTISPYLFFWQASEEVEEEQERGETPALATTHIGAMRVDVIAGMASAVVIMFAIMVASAATLGAHGGTTIKTADQAALALKPLAGGLASLLFTAGIVGTGLLAVPVLAGSTGYALAEAFGLREGLSKKLRDASAFYGIIAASTLVGVILNFAGVNPIRALYWSAILNGVTAPPLILLMFILSNSHRHPERRMGGRISDLFIGLAFLVMLALPIAYLLS